MINALKIVNKQPILFYINLTKLINEVSSCKYSHLT